MAMKHGMNLQSCRLSLAALPLLALGLVDSASGYSFPPGLGSEIENPPEAGYPGFFNLSQLEFEKKLSGGFRLTATGTGRYYQFDRSPVAGDEWLVSNASFTLVAHWSNLSNLLNGTLSSGTVDIKGKIPGFVGTAAEKSYSYTGSHDVTNTTGTLYHADLKLSRGTGIDTSPWGLGFTTLGATDSGWASQFQTGNESVWFYEKNLWSSLTSAITLNGNKRSWSLELSNVKTITTVPVPAAVWLLGSGLMALAGARRWPGANILAA